jgi:hypothetical protein
MRIHDHGLRQTHIPTNLTFAAANGAGFLLMELVWVPLTPSSRSACCHRTASINLSSTFRVEKKTNTGSWIAKASNLNEILGPLRVSDFQLARPQNLGSLPRTRNSNHEHMMASWIPTRISLIPNFARDTRSSKSPKIDIP